MAFIEKLWRNKNPMKGPKIPLTPQRKVCPDILAFDSSGGAALVTQRFHRKGDAENPMYKVNLVIDLRSEIAEDKAKHIGNDTYNNESKQGR